MTGPKCKVVISPDCPSHFPEDEDYKMSFRVHIEGTEVECLPGEVSIDVTLTLKDGTECKITQGATMQPSNAGTPTKFTQKDFDEIYRVVVTKKGKCSDGAEKNYDFSDIDGIAVSMKAVAADTSHDEKECKSKKKTPEERKKCKVEIKPVNCSDLFIPGEDYKMSFRVTISGPKADCLPGTVSTQAILTFKDGMACKVSQGVTMQPSNPGDTTKFKQEDSIEVYRVVLAKSGKCKMGDAEQDYDFSNVEKFAISMGAFAKDGTPDSAICSVSLKKKK